MLKIGLTGGIGSGKTAASDHFAELGAEVIDTDLLSRELVQPGQPALQEIVATFGDAVLDSDGRLDRAALRARVFADPGARRQLEAILHPRIRSAMLARAADSNAPYVVFVIPLLLETGQQSLVDRVLVIDVPVAVQRARVAARSGIDAAEIDAILAAQVTREQRVQAADDLIVNDGTLAQLHAAVAHLHRKYMEQVQH
ncbi:MAG: dephospho-CoA kinase [Gammaproteobacteria bacterium]|nr:dephospho-CoA kinase [Gammaproteobacteria bacterium]